MEQEINAGYVITDRLTVGKCEFVIGQSETAPDRFVTWRRNLGEKEFYWGNYVGDRLTAVADLCRRAMQEVEFLQSLQPQPENQPKNKMQPDPSFAARNKKDTKTQPFKKLPDRGRDR